MTSPFLGEIRLFAGNFQPRGWAFCDGRLLSINQNDALFSLIGTTYGGDGFSTFAVPDLRGRLPVHQGTLPGGSTYNLGQAGGVETVTLASNQVPSHTHALNATTATGTAQAPGTSVMLATPVEANVKTSLYVVPGSSTVNLTPMASQSIATTGGGQAHTNMMPTQALNYIIALEGIFPARN